MLDADWDREAARFDLAPDHGLLEGEVRRAWRRLLQAHLPAAPAQVLDIGGGSGSLSILLAEEVNAVSGVDFSSEMLARSSSRTMAAGAVAARAPPARAGALLPLALDVLQSEPRAHRAGRHQRVLSRRGRSGGQRRCPP